MNHFNGAEKDLRCSPEVLPSLYILRSCSYKLCVDSEKLFASKEQETRLMHNTSQIGYLCIELLGLTNRGSVHYKQLETRGMWIRNHVSQTNVVYMACIQPHLISSSSFCKHQKLNIILHRT